MTSGIDDFGHCDSMLSRALRSPFAHQISINKGDKALDIEEAKTFFKSHVDEWTAFWQRRGIAELSEVSLQNKQTRDSNLHELLINEDKFRLASFLGPNFAPVADTWLRRLWGPFGINMKREKQAV